MQAVLERSVSQRPSWVTLPPTEHSLQFDGRAGEYFRIWIVNVALSVITLGVYSAWAKVRTLRYFYACTRLNGVPFEYSGRPWAILRGRIVAASLLGAYVLLDQFAPVVWSACALLLIALLLPPIVVSSLKFRARHSSWCAVSFSFDGGVGSAYWRFLALPLLTALPAFLFFPRAKWRQHQYIAMNHRFGHSRFEYGAPLASYYIAYLVAAAALFGVAVAAPVLVAALPDGVASPTGLAVLMLVLLPVVYLAYFAVFVGLRTALSNRFWNNVKLGEHRIHCTLSPLAMSGLFLGNAVAIILSMGLLVPWAKIRVAKYRARHWVVVSDSDLDGFASEHRPAYGALGSEVGESFGLDLSV